MLSWIVQDSHASTDPLSEDQLAAQVISMLTAGHETTALWLTISLHRTLGDRRAWARMVADPTSTSWIEESLRVDGPVQCIWRRARTDGQVGTVTIPAGAKVSIILPSANVDQTVFESPEVYDPERSSAAARMAQRLFIEWG